MRFGLLSDSHGRVERTRRAIERLLAIGVDELIHLGDIETESVIDALVGHPVRLVFGNCDDVRALSRYCEYMSLAHQHPAGRIDVGGRSIVYTHGHLNGELSGALDSGVDYLLHGHTHEIRDERIGPTRIINPGALHRASRYTVAVLDVFDDSVVTIEVS